MCYQTSQYGEIEIAVLVASIYVRWEISCKFLEIFQFLAELKVISVEQNGKNGLCRTCIVDNLVCKEYMISVFISWRCVALFVLPLEQENESVDLSTR